VEPSGAAVIAGRSAPLARVTIRSGGSIVGEGKADERGEWIVVPTQPLPPGTHELTVEMVGAGGSTRVGDDLVVIVVPPQAAAGETATTPLAVKASRSGNSPSTILQPTDGDAGAALAIETVYGGTDRRLTISGRAPPHSRLRLYLDNALLGEATADSLGLWRFVLQAPVPDGEHSLRADAVTGRGDVVARVRVPLRIDGGGAALVPPRPGDGHVVVERGDSLWRIAQAMYGEGTAYTIIYDANRHQIDDPDLIYPGQVFQLPNTQ
jgi:nucleoid-associated protein YgaU